MIYFADVFDKLLHTMTPTTTTMTMTMAMKMTIRMTMMIFPTMYNLPAILTAPPQVNNHGRARTHALKPHHFFNWSSKWWFWSSCWSSTDHQLIINPHHFFNWSSKWWLPRFQLIIKMMTMVVVLIIVDHCNDDNEPIAFISYGDETDFFENEIWVSQLTMLDCSCKFKWKEIFQSHPKFCN